MKKIMTIISILFTSFYLLFKHKIIHKLGENSNVWVNECKTCHSDYKELAKQAGIQTEQYYFNFVYYHKNKDGKEFGTILSKKKLVLFLDLY